MEFWERLCYNGQKEENCSNGILVYHNYIM